MRTNQPAIEHCNSARTANAKIEQKNKKLNKKTTRNAKIQNQWKYNKYAYKAITTTTKGVTQI